MSMLGNIIWLIIGGFFAGDTGKSRASGSNETRGQPWLLGSLLEHLAATLDLDRQDHIRRTFPALDHRRLP